ncbi:M13 family metallopeptidase [Uliginosibacterium paludis]|uniref:M13 family metallopeptidase n=1 Tax=Uliginosibacterium paludis TaxID=1615952 RepID=A0ABV2CWH3_9RHOO
MKLISKPFAGLALVACFGAAGVCAAPLSSGIEAGNADPAVRAQDNLFQAVNGGWVKRTEIPADESNIGAFLTVFDLTQERCRVIAEALGADATGEAALVRAMYRSYMNTDQAGQLGIQPISRQLDEIARLDGKPALMRLLGRWQGENRRVSLPLAFHVDLDQKAPARYLATVSQDGLAMPDRDYYLEQDPRFVQARKAYVDYLTASFTALKLDRPAQRAAEVMALETGIARIQWDKVKLRDPIAGYNKFQRGALSTKVRGFDWKPFLEAAGAGGIATLDVSQPSYVTALGALIRKTPVGTWQDYLRIRLLDAYAPYLDEASVARHFAFHGTALSGSTQNRPRWKRGLRLINETLGEAMGKLYVEKHFPPEHKARMQALVKNLLSAYAADIDTLDWMESDQSRKGAHAKLDKLMVKIGYPEKWRGYPGLVLDEHDLVGNIRKAEQLEFTRELSEINDPVDRTRWGMAPQIVNAYYNPVFNEIVFPAAILQPPFFDMAADDAVNYGGIGAVIGHEISHGFDDWGSQYDADGMLNPWMSEADKTRFKALTHRVVEQYNGYEALPGKFVNGELTLGENIADIAGLAIAYKAYSLSLGGQPAPVIDGMSGPQRFFTGFAQVWRSKIRPEALLARIVSDPHSPPEFRVIGATANNEAFHETFGVKPGDGMFRKPEERVRIW